MAYDKNYYITKGFEEPVAEYFASGRKKIIEVYPKDDFKLVLKFDGGEMRLLDCRGFIKEGTVFETLLDKEAFKRVYLDDNNCVSWDIDPSKDSTVFWDNKLDLDPDSCYVDSIPYTI